MSGLSIREQLAAPFDPINDIEWRVQRAGETNGRRWAMVLAYVDNRAIMERLDDVFGVGGWENVFQPLPDGGIICGIKARIDDGIERTKYDGADKTAIEATKGGISNAMKRAGVQWGIGRYLYNLEATFVDVLTKDEKLLGVDYITAIIDRQKFFYKRPEMPKWALPADLRAGTK